CSFRRNGRHGAMLDNSTSAVEDCRFTDNAEYGLWLDDASAASGGKLLGCSFSGNKAGISASPPAVALAQNSSFEGNREGAVHVREGALSLPSVWRRLGEPYMIIGTVVVDGKAALSVEPGTVLKLTSGAGIVVNGVLRLESSLSNPIVLTSFKDDEFGGDTNADGGASLPSPGNWDGIVFAPTGSGVLSGCCVRYGGAARQVAEGLFTYGAVSIYSDAVTLENVELYGNRTGIYCRGASPKISNCRVLDSRDIGIQCVDGASPAVSGCTIGGVYQNPNYGIAADAKSLLSTSAEPRISRNTLSGNKWAFSISPAATANLSGDNRVFGNVNGAVLLSKGEIAGSVVWPAFEGAYGLAGTVTVTDSGSLSLLPGVVVKGQQDAGIVAAGRIEAVGLPEARIVFTSFKDDSVAGDSNGDRNTTAPQPGDWIGIMMDGGRGAFEFCDIRYAGQSVDSTRPQAGLYCKGASPPVKSCVFESNAGYGLYGDDTSFRQSADMPLIQGCLFRGNDWGLHLHSESTVNL
ncbi:MAG: right-handed parallel beta-helix repeat-containing protein, partial [Armatimonadota bacterium]